MHRWLQCPPRCGAAAAPPRMNAPLHRLFAPIVLLLASHAASAQEPKPAPASPGIPECKEMTKTALGLEYGFLKKGSDQPPPGPADQVRVHYTGWLTDGTRFDGSRDSGKPSEFYLSGMLIKGWVEGLQLMTPGARCKFVFPAN